MVLSKSLVKVSPGLFGIFFDIRHTTYDIRHTTDDLGDRWGNLSYFRYLFAGFEIFEIFN